MKLQTINVVEYRSDTVLSVQSFSDKKEAEDMFTSMMREKDNVSDEDVKISLAEGLWEEGDYQIFLVYSS